MVSCTEKRDKMTHEEDIKKIKKSRTVLDTTKSTVNVRHVWEM